MASGVLEMVAECMEWQAAALEKHGGQVLTDSVSHHCWLAPPPSLCPHGPLTTAALAAEGKKCNCGAVSLAQISVDAVWTTLGSDLAVLDTAPPPSVSYDLSLRSPDLFDLLACRRSALSCAAQLAQTLLTTAWVLTHAETL